MWVSWCKNKCIWKRFTCTNRQNFIRFLHELLSVISIDIILVFILLIIEYYKNKTCLFSYQFCHILFYTGICHIWGREKQIQKFLASKEKLLSLIGASQVGVYQGLDYCRPVMLVHSQVRRNQGRGQGAHCLGMSYHVNFLGGLDSNEFHIKWRFGTHGSWKKSKSWGPFRSYIPAKQHCQFRPFGPFFRLIGWIGSVF